MLIGCGGPSRRRRYQQRGRSPIATSELDRKKPARLSLLHSSDFALGLARVSSVRK
jgi:hypothetical protein